MKISTSRDPSPKARRLARVLARFLGIPYITRGKQALEEGEWLIVVESHGNPSGFAKRLGDREDVLRFTISSEPKLLPLKARPPTVDEASEDAEAIARFFELDVVNSPRVIKERYGHLEFRDDGNLILGLKI